MWCRALNLLAASTDRDRRGITCRFAALLHRGCRGDPAGRRVRTLGFRLIREHERKGARTFRHRRGGPSTDDAREGDPPRGEGKKKATKLDPPGRRAPARAPTQTCNRVDLIKHCSRWRFAHARLREHRLRTITLRTSIYHPPCLALQCTQFRLFRALPVWEDETNFLRHPQITR